MDYVNAFFLLTLGFFVGLSGAVMPGPLLVYTINESLRRGKWVGAMVIIGHAIVEISIFVLLVFGLLELVSSPEFVRAVSLVGGTALLLMAYRSFKDVRSGKEYKAKEAKYGLVAGGIIFTAFNPGMPVWWMTAGTSLLMEGFRQMQYAGMVLVLVGHWFADLGWFVFVSMTASRGSRYLLREGWYRNVRMVLSVVLLVIGIYFLSKAI